MATNYNTETAEQFLWRMYGAALAAEGIDDADESDDSDEYGEGGSTTICSFGGVSGKDDGYGPDDWEEDDEDDEE